jgi:hypothetical protein
VVECNLGEALESVCIDHRYHDASFFIFFILETTFCLPASPSETEGCGNWRVSGHPHADVFRYFFTVALGLVNESQALLLEKNPYQKTYFDIEMQKIRFLKWMKNHHDRHGKETGYRLGVSPRSVPLRRRVGRNRYLSASGARM